MIVANLGVGANINPLTHSLAHAAAQLNLGPVREVFANHRGQIAQQPSLKAFGETIRLFNIFVFDLAGIMRGMRCSCPDS